MLGAPEAKGAKVEAREESKGQGGLSCCGHEMTGGAKRLFIWGLSGDNIGFGNSVGSMGTRPCTPENLTAALKQEQQLGTHVNFILMLSL